MNPPTAAIPLRDGSGIVSAEMSTVKDVQLIEYIAERAGLNRGDVRQMLSEFQDALVFFFFNGQGIKLPLHKSHLRAKIACCLLRWFFLYFFK